MYKIKETPNSEFTRAGLCYTYEQLNIISTFQRLFTQLSISMRSVIAAYVFKTANFDAVSKNLMSIPEGFRDAFVVFYGPAIADRFNALMTTFISNIFPAMEGYTSKNDELLSHSTQKWYRDADQIATFLNSINIFWDTAQWVNLFNQYIQLKFTMINAFYTGNYDFEQQIYNRVFDLTSIMGTYMAQGLIARDLLRQATPPLAPTTPQFRRP